MLDKRNFHAKEKFLYVGPEKEFNGLFYSQLAMNVALEPDEEDDEELIYMMSRERHEQIASKQGMLVEVDMGSVGDIEDVKIGEEGLAGLIWSGDKETFKKSFKQCGKTPK